MVDPAIDAFFEEREVFSRETWLPKAAKRAGQMSLSTHPCTFSHPSARKNKNSYVTPVIADAENFADGYLRSGNVTVEIDALGNAAVLDVYKFLTLEMEDSKKLIEHIQNDSDLAVSLLSIKTESYESLKNGFLKMTKPDDQRGTITSSKIKQVYFPVNDTYHQLSILSNSGMIYELKTRIDSIRFSNEIKEQREKKRNNTYSIRGFSELYNLTTIGYGGTKPQNISVLNNRNAGKAHLLISMPPTLKKRDTHFPKQNFFRESFQYFEYRDVFYALHKLFKTDYNNVRIREGRDYRLQDLMDRIVSKMWAVRAVSAEQYQSKHSQLKRHQEIWLCEEFLETREQEDVWLEKLCLEIARWVIHTYGRLLGKQAIKLDEDVRRHVYKIVINNREALR